MNYKSTFYFVSLLSLLQQNLLAFENEKAGDILRILIPASALATTLYLDDEDGQTQFYKSFGTNILITYGLKYTIDKERPNGEEHSFPSGHTSVAFQGATFIHKRYGFYSSLPTYAAAMYVAYSRVDSNNHYWSDVIAGAIIGSVSSYYFTDAYEIKTLEVKEGFGLSLSYRW